jgi:ribonuclease BN (tRNA processing enzyme)
MNAQGAADVVRSPLLTPTANPIWRCLRALRKPSAQEPTSPAQTDFISACGRVPLLFGWRRTLSLVFYLLLILTADLLLIRTRPDLMQMGSAFLRIGEMQIDLDRVDTILLTHLHIDHTGDLPGFFKARTLTASASAIRFNVFGPAGAGLFPSTTKLLDLLFEKGGAWEYQKTFGADEEIHGVDLPIDLNLPESRIVDVQGLRITAIATHHDDCPSVAYRVDYGGESVAFSGDMDASALPNLIRLAKGCSLLVMHCAVLDPPKSPQQLYAFHTPPHKIGEAARDAGVKRLLLSHIAPDIEEASRAVLESIRASYKGPVSFAHDKMRVALGTVVSPKSERRSVRVP